MAFRNNNKRVLLAILLVLFVLASLGIAVSLVRQNQDIRKGASSVPAYSPFTDVSGKPISEGVAWAQSGQLSIVGRVVENNLSTSGSIVISAPNSSGNRVNYKVEVMKNIPSVLVLKVPQGKFGLTEEWVGVKLSDVQLLTPVGLSVIAHVDMSQSDSAKYINASSDISVGPLAAMVIPN